MLGVAASVVANVLHARQNPVSETIAAWPPLALLLTVELISRVPVHRRGWAAVRLCATAAIAGIAAWVSYWHMAGVASRYGETGASPYLLPLSVDGLVVVASVSLVELAGRIRAAADARTSGRTDERTDGRTATVPAAVRGSTWVRAADGVDGRAGQAATSAVPEVADADSEPVGGPSTSGPSVPTVSSADGADGRADGADGRAAATVVPIDRPRTDGGRHAAPGPAAAVRRTATADDARRVAGGRTDISRDELRVLLKENNLSASNGWLSELLAAVRADGGRRTADGADGRADGADGRADGAVDGRTRLRPA
jgi:hypothetical protein